ncbi:MAG: hemerythrin domain-containing protein [Ferruginibacter sp.]
MKRHEALAPLSREHHDTLILAQLLKKGAPEYKGMPNTDKDKAGFAQKQFEEIIKEHFKKEELVLEKAWGSDIVINELITEIKNEHQQLTALFLSLNSTTKLEDTLDELGRMLEVHVRKEERVLFPLLQQHCSEDVLQQIHILLH